MILAGLTLLAVLIFSQRIEFTSIDLGRHLANGREIWHDAGLLFRNFYSYTEPDFRFINHHWLGGVLYYAAYLAGGLKALSVLNIIVWLATCYLAWRLARKKAGFYWAAALALPAVVLLSQRPDIRPENFSYLFLLLVWLILEKTESDSNWRRLRWLLALFIVWVNTHIYFFVGLGLLAFWSLAKFLPQAWRALWNGAGAREIWQAGWEPSRTWIKYSALAVLVCLLNPNTWRGLLYPLGILREYGYDIAENKSIFFLENLSTNPGFFLFKAGLVLLVISFIAYWLVKRRLEIYPVLVAVFFSGLALFASRNLALFSLVAFVAVSRNLSELGYLGTKLPVISDPEQGQRLKIAGAGLLLVAIILTGTYLYSDAANSHEIIRHPLGWDSEEGSMDSAQFFRDSGLTGPIFNNYDLGSALTFWLYPKEKVFVDNRPEAYSVSFFRNIYKPMQENSYDWERYRQAYGIKTIYFSHTDMTPWARQFLRRILADQAWSLVYVDRYVVILADKQATDPAIIEKYALDNNALRARIRELAAQSGYNVRLYLAFLANAAGDPDISEEIYRQILIEDTDNARVLAALGTHYAGSGDPVYMAQSINYLSRAIANGYVLPSTYNTRGLVHFSRGEYEEAAADWRAALKLERNNAEAKSYLEQLESLHAEGKIPPVN